MTALALGCAACGGPKWAGPEPPKPLDGLASAEPVVLTPADDLLPSVSANGRHLAVASEVNGNLDVWIQDFASDSFYPLTRTPSDDYDPDIAPDGRRVAFASRRADAKGDVFIADLKPGADARRITGPESSDRQPVFAPDGQRVYFTSSTGTGPERIHSVDRNGGDRRTVSPGRGFDPEPSPDGRHLVYTVPGTPERPEPHLVVSRLTDGSTVALTRGRGPEGFARFVPDRPSSSAEGVTGVERPWRIVFVRFPDDDDGDGRRDAGDRSSLWELRVDDLATLFETDARPAPFPLTDGSEDDLFPAPGPFFLFYTRGSPQDILRIRHDGIFPRYTDAEGYFRLAESIEDPRTRWFAYRCILAISAADDPAAARARLAIGRLHRRRRRPDLAKAALSPLLAHAGATRSPELGLARVELLALEREATEPDLRDTRDFERRLDRIELEHSGQDPVLARADLERALIVAWRGEEEAAAERLARIESRWRGQSEVAARAALERLRLLDLGTHADALGAAYANVGRRYGHVDWVLQEVADRVVDVHAGDLVVDDGSRGRAESIARVLDRYRAPLLRSELRVRAAEIRRETGQLSEAARELERARALRRDAYGRARILVRLARTYEDLGRADDAVEAWRALRRVSRDLPVHAAKARAALTRANLARGREAEATGRLEEALEAYERVVEDDPQQVTAQRRRIALIARTGRLEAEIESARMRARGADRTPVHHYVLGLAYTWRREPDLDAARRELDRAIELNPQLGAAYLARGWVHEMKQLEEAGFFASFFRSLGDALTLMFGAGEGALGGSGWIELAIEDYKTALRLNPESSDPEFEAQILTNLGNAHYRLGDETNDRTNVELAYLRYTEALRLGLELRDDRRTFVFWERLGRSAIWRGAWADAVTATRRAIGLAERLGLEDRLAQLYGNLSLAYDRARQPDRAREALRRFERELDARGFDERKALAHRNEARARLEGPEGHDPVTLTLALRDLRLGRRALESHGVDRGDVPSLWRPVVPNASRAQFGFDESSERALQMALEEVARRRLGDHDEAEALRDERIRSNEKIASDIPRRYLFFSAYLTTLVTLRERVGLMAIRALDAFRDGEVDAAFDDLEAIRKATKQWVDDADRISDRLAHAVDLARIDALGAQMVAAARSKDRLGEALERLELSDRGLLQAVAPGDNATVAWARLDPSDLSARIPEIDTSTRALARTASVALTQSPLSEDLRQARSTRARLAWAKARLHAFEASLARREIEAKDPASPIRVLDARAEAWWDARRGLLEAIRWGAGAGPGEGALVVAAALGDLADIARVTGLGPDPRRTEARAARLAAAVGALDLAFWLSVDSGADPPSWCGHPGARAAVEARWAAGIREALHADDGPRAWELADRWTSARICRRGLPARASERHPGDAERLDGLRAARARLQAAREALFRSGTEADRAEVGHAVAALRSAEAEVEDASALARLRWRGRTVPLDEVRAALSDDEMLVVAVPVGGRVELLWTDGSTATDAPVRHATARLSASELRGLLESAWSDHPPPRGSLREAIVEPLEEVDEDAGNRRILWSGALVGPPIPERSSPVDLLTHVASPSVVPRLAEELALGGARGIVLRSVEVEETTASPSDAGDPSAAQTIPLSPDLARGLEMGRPLLPPRYFAFAWFDAPFAPRALHPERSELGSRDRSVEDDAGGTALATLDVVTLPAPVGVWTRWKGADASSASALHGLDYALAATGISTGLVAPAGDDVEAGRRRARATLAAVERGGFGAAWTTWKQSAGPEVGASVVVGLPGLSEREASLRAASELSEAQRSALAAVRAGAYREAAPRLRRWLQLQKAAGTSRYVPAVYKALVGLHRNQITPPDPVRAAAVQREFLDYLDEREAPLRTRIDAVVTLGELLSEAGAVAAAEEAFADAFGRIDALGSGREGARGAARYHYGQHFRRHTQLEDAVGQLELAIESYEAIGTYEDPDWPEEARQALARVGDLYLNRLSDPDRAEQAYARELRRVTAPREKIRARLDLARVARRRGDFETAQERARRVESEARSLGFPLLVLEGGIERANAAWVRGDYDEAEALCQTSLDRGQSAREEVLADASIDTAVSRERRLAQVDARRVFALSVCGLTAMRQGRFDAAMSRLRSARALAQTLDLPAEVATQYNNLGRVYLEFGRFEEAADAFRRARAIDRRRKDVYALAYDDRNLGRALSLLGDPGAEEVLLRALAGARRASDRNNEGRALYALAEHLRSVGRLEEAEARYLELLELETRGALFDRIWAAHWALGRIARAHGDRAEAEARWRAAVSEVRRLGPAVGRFNAVGPGRQDPYDDLVALALDAGQTAAAFAWAEEGRALEALVELSRPEVRVLQPAWTEPLEQARTATAAVARRRAWSRVAELAPDLAATFAPIGWSELGERVPEGRALLVYRALSDELVVFVVTATSSSVVRVPVSRDVLAKRVARQRRALERRAEVAALLSDLGEALLAPWTSAASPSFGLDGVDELVIVPWSFLRDVAWPALSDPRRREDAGQLIDRFRVTLATAPRGVTHRTFARSRSPAVLAPSPDGFSGREARAIREARPGAVASTGSEATRSVWRAALATSRPVHFAGHLAVAPEGTGPLRFGLQLADGPAPFAGIIERPVRAPWLALSMCAPDPDRWPASEPPRWVRAFHAAGAEAVIAPMLELDDVAAAVFAKHLHRAAERAELADAVRTAQLRTRAHWPHPGWWAAAPLWVRAPAARGPPAVDRN